MSSRRKRDALTPFQEFFKSEAAGGGVLLVCACAALVVANSGLGDAYHQLWETRIPAIAGARQLSLSLHGWINDGLMAVFFLLVGLEIKREALVGELASLRRAALPVAAAAGGMVAPALIYTITNGNGSAASGWAIPMATDIAFALGVLALVAPKAPPGLKVFLAALAIVDDIGAVLVIAVFYTSTLVWSSLGAAAAVLALLAMLNRRGVRHLAPYLLLGLALWYFVHDSGVHATVAGVLLAFTIPSAPRPAGLHDRASGAPLLTLEHALQRFCGLVVMPLFAFANAGVALVLPAAASTTGAVILGLVLGKPLGIIGASWLAVRLGWGRLPEGVRWRALHGCAWLGGIGFTMSLFIANLAFDDVALTESAKAGIFVGSIVAGIVGAALVRTADRAQRAPR